MKASSYLIKGGTLIDGTGNTPIRDAAVVVRDGVIISVGKSGQIDAPTESRILDASGKTIMPGMIDAHSHMAYPPYADVTDILSGTIESLTLAAMRNAKNYLHAGFTCLRDLNGPGNVALRIRDEIDAGLLEGPRMKCARKFICPTGGGVDYATGHGDVSFARRADGPIGVLVAVREELAAGSDLIKLEGSGACDSPSCPSDIQTYSDEEMVAGVTEAHRRGKRVSFHAEGTQGAKAAIRAGADTIEHGFHLDKECIAMMKERGTTLEPTIGMVGNRLPENGCKIKLPDWVVDNCRIAFEGSKNTLVMAREAGVKIALGTDAGAINYPHAAGARELEYMVDFGFTEMEAILVATRNAAEAVDLADTIGTIEKGKAADILMINGDPLRDIRVLQNPEAISVMKAGRLIKGWI